MKSLQNKVAIVTGGGSGIGKAISLLYAAEGAKVVVSDINEAHGNAVADEIKKNGGEAFLLKQIRQARKITGSWLNKPLRNMALCTSL